MLTATVLDIKYHRLLVEEMASPLGECLKQDFDYSFVVSYGNFEDVDYSIMPKKSCVIDLTFGIENVFKGFNPTCRNEVRKADKIEGLEFRAEIKDFDAFYAFHKNCEAERGWKPVPESELANSIVFSVYYYDIPLAGMTCYASNNMLRIGRIFTRRRSEEWEHTPKVLFSAASRKIVFEFCKYGIEQGYKSLDLGGIDPEDPSKAGITQFKLSFGGKIHPVLIGRYANQRFLENEHLIKKAGYDIT